MSGEIADGLRVPVVVELFTSEGCSSCPAADSLLARLDDAASRYRPTGLPVQVEIIALGEHVDYWDDLGWKDRFSSPLFSARQQDYGMAFRAPSVYTPQAVVNGAKQVLGSDGRALSRAIAELANAPRAIVEMRIAASPKTSGAKTDSKPNGDSLFLRVGKLPLGSNTADVLLAVAESNIETTVQGGENTGRRLKHTAVVRSMSRLAELDPAKPGEYSVEARLNLRDDWKRGNLKIVVLVQDRQTRRILGAAAVKL